MNKMFKKTPLFLKVAILIAVLVLIVIIFVTSGSDDNSNILVVTSKNFVQKLSVTGNVEASQSSDLGFAQSGRISKTYVQVGESVKRGAILAEIENGDLRASLLQKQAVLSKELANLSTKQQGTRPEQLALTQQKYDDAVSAYITSLYSAYLNTEDAILSNVDLVFSYGTSVRPVLELPTDNRNQQESIQNKRLLVTEGITKWKELVTALNSAGGNKSKTEIEKVRVVAESTLSKSKDLINDLSKITSGLAVSQPYSQETIDTYRAGVITAGQLISTATSDINTSRTSMNTAENSLLLEKAGSTSNDLNAQQAIVKAAEADVLSAQSQLEKSIVRAPFDGIVTRMDAKVGEIATSNTSSISINSVGTFIIKSNIPEVYISNLAVGDRASTTLDAYGPNVTFPLKVIAVDPAQTVVNGVSNYKATLQFTEQDSRIRPGMTANIDIITEDIPNTFVIPAGAIVDTDGKKIVMVNEGGEIISREVTVGVTSSVGEVQITSGLNEGDIIMLNPKSL
jgi:HlyD family secretion protein